MLQNPLNAHGLFGSKVQYSLNDDPPKLLLLVFNLLKFGNTSSIPALSDKGPKPIC